MHPTIADVARISVWIVLALCFAATPANAQPAKFPDRPIKIVVGFAPGGGTDVAARVLAQKLTEGLGQAVVVENRPGASGMIADEAVAKAAPDGYTLMMGTQTALAVAPNLYRKFGLDPAKEFVGVSMTGISPSRSSSTPRCRRGRSRT
jgi:tripartite-type tricarboxylate transporter receptor subunit TctC